MYSWLEYSLIVDAAFCFPCRCFNGNESNIGQTEKVFTKTGFNSWYRASERLKSHQISKYHINNWKNVIAVCFDGAATMAGNINGVQAKCKNKNKNILHVHCYAHCLNLTLMDAVCANAKYSEVNKCVFDFLGTVQFIYSFIEGSPIRHAVFEKFAKLDGAKVQTLKSMSQTRWACRADAVNAVKNNYKALLCTLKEISSKCLIPEARAKCRGLLYQLKTFEFIYCLNLMQPILQLILKVSSSLQASNLELFTAVSLTHALRSSLNSIRKSPQEIQSIFINTEQMCKENNIEIPTVKNRKVSKKRDDLQCSTSQHIYLTKSEEMKVTVVFPLLDVLLSGIDDRFKQETSDLITVIGQLINLELNCNSSCIYILKNLLNIRTQDLFVEIKLLKSLEDTPKGTSSDYVYKWLDWLAIEGRSDTFKTFYNCLTYFVFIPVTSCGCERSFSKMSIVKTKLRSTMTQERLNALLFLFIEQEYVSNINIESVIDDFQNVPTKRRLIL
ncbi:zinc finger MYM-type protein 1-like [Metopolophium dirhodum]|uniref:zinc finger MYM-type protein 1-like n=1 Tax=Metopolophium dirhodum TaxID=44670 RepID=UPI00299064F5|nr:zinc finger MYM-type protein 1-like [Metopolophium dirhodum]